MLVRFYNINPLSNSNDKDIVWYGVLWSNMVSSVTLSIKYLQGEQKFSFVKKKY